MENELIIKEKNLVSLLSGATPGELLKPLQNEILLFETYVAGTSHVKDQTVFHEIGAGDRLILRREPDNRFDENAILVLDSRQRKLGYIPEKDNLIFARLMDAGKYLTARIERVEAKSAFTEIRIAISLIDY